MIKLEDLEPDASVRGILPNCSVTVVTVQQFDSEVMDLADSDRAGTEFSPEGLPEVSVARTVAKP